MADETALLYEDPKIIRNIREAKRKFEQEVKYEMELCNDPHMIKNMGHFAKSRVLDLLVDGEDPADIVRYFEEVTQSFRTYRAQQISSNPIRVFKRPQDTPAEAVLGLRLIKTGY